MGRGRAGVFISVVGDSAQAVGSLRAARAELDRLEKTASSASSRAAAKFSAMGDRMTQFGRKATLGVTLPFLAVAGAATRAASDLEESQTKVQRVFGKSSKRILDWSKTSAKAFGQSTQQALEAVGTFGNLFTALKLPEDQSVKMSKRLTVLASDLASFNNISTDEALTALRAGIVGEVEPLRRLGISLNDAMLREQALRMGLVKTTKEVLPPAIKAQAAYALIFKQSKKAQGDFQRTADGVANRQRIVTAEFENAKAVLGRQLLPVAQKLLSWASDVLTKFSNLSPRTQELILKMAAFAAAAGPVVGILGGVSRGIGGVIRVAGGLGRVTGIIRGTSAAAGVAAGNVGRFAGGIATARANAGAATGVLGKLRGGFSGVATAVGGLNGAMAAAGLMATAYGKAQVQSLQNQNLMNSTLNTETIPTLLKTGKNLAFTAQDTEYLFGLFGSGNRKKVSDIFKRFGEGAINAGDAVRELGEIAGATEEQVQEMIDAQLLQKLSVAQSTREWGPFKNAATNAIRSGLINGGDFVDMLKEAGLRTKEIKRLLEDMPRDITIRIRQKFVPLSQENLERSGRVSGARADGGRVASGVPYLIGERGPERFIPDLPGRIVPNSHLRAGGGTVSIHNSITVEIQGDVAPGGVRRMAEEVVRLLEERQRRMARPVLGMPA